jgi:hypothetical protein
MSNDYPLAVKAGATLIRVGTGIFGERIYWTICVNSQKKNPEILIIGDNIS